MICYCQLPAQTANEPLFVLASPLPAVSPFLVAKSMSYSVCKYKSAGVARSPVVIHSCQRPHEYLIVGEGAGINIIQL